MNNTNLQERLDILRQRIQDRDYLEGNGLSNEINIRIFCYDPAKEMTIRHFIDQLLADPTLACHPIELNLYRIFIGVCEELDILDSIVEMEEQDGSDYVLEQLHCAVGEDEYIASMCETVGTPKTGDILILTGVGDVFPFMRVHKILEAMQPHFSNVPILVMYPGSFNGTTLQLFDTLCPNPYYRAFDAV